jgi:hypothetical protein
LEAMPFIVRLMGVQLSLSQPPPHLLDRLPVTERAVRAGDC